MSVEDLTVANENLRSQIIELSETVATLDAENQELLNKNKSNKDENRDLHEIADRLKASMEEMQKKVEGIREKMDGANRKIHELEEQNKSLVTSNAELSKELHEVSCQVALFRHYKAAQERDLSEMQTLSAEVKKHLRSLEERLDNTEQHYHVEKDHSSQLKEKVSFLLHLRENQRKDIKDLQAQLETCVQQATFLRLDRENQLQTGSLMHEIMEARLVDVALNNSRQREILHWLGKLGKFLAVLVLGCGLILILAFTYTYFINDKFIVETVRLFLSEQNIERIVLRVSQYLTWKNDGLLPF
ncbi:Serine/threonine-protein kinase MRCK gamma [Varanus komodoensis]|nr:Serine/threonine-protein kinase MRCK gamma [Varanus komodoensis]